MKSKFYLVRLFNLNKLLFGVVMLFILLNLAANFIYKTEHTPIFKWDLYSYKLPQQNTYSFLEIKYNEDELLLFPHTYDEPEKLYFINTLDYFILMKRNKNIDLLKNYIDNWNINHPFFNKIMPGIKFYNDAIELKKFPLWFKRYLEQHLNKPVYKIDIYEVKAAYMDEGEVKKISSTLIYKLL